MEHILRITIKPCAELEDNEDGAFDAYSTFAEVCDDKNAYVLSTFARGLPFSHGTATTLASAVVDGLLVCFTRAMRRFQKSFVAGARRATALGAYVPAETSQEADDVEMEWLGQVSAMLLHFAEFDNSIVREMQQWAAFFVKVMEARSCPCETSEGIIAMLRTLSAAWATETSIRSSSAAKLEAKQKEALYRPEIVSFRPFRRGAGNI